MEALQLKFEAKPEQSIAEQSAEQASKQVAESLPAPLMILLGGGGYGDGRSGEEALLAKLELLMGLAHLVKYEKDGITVALCGELAVYVLAFVVGISFDQRLLQGIGKLEERKYTPSAQPHLELLSC
eukprot:4408272-Amphidinium_carterae.1